MATATNKPHCVKCGKERATSKCSGCSQDFCYNHLTDHRQELNGQLDEIEVNRDVFRQTLTEQTTNPKKHSLIKQIDQWEEDSISKIQQTAKKCRQLILQHTSEQIHQIELNLAKLTDQLRETRQENDFNEIDLRQFKQKLKQLAEELDQPSNISIQYDSASFINKISVVVSSRQLFSSYYINNNTKWKQNGVTIVGGNGKGNQLNQLSRPRGIYVDDDNQCIYIADCDNHRIVEWKFGAKSGQVVAGGNNQGDRMNQLSSPSDVIVDKKNDSIIICDSEKRRVVRWPRRNGTNGQTIISDIACYRLAMDNNGDLYVSDYEKHEVRRWKIGEISGTIVAGGNGNGNQLNQLNAPSGIFVDEVYSVYVSDWNNNRVMKWLKGAQEGIVVAGGQGEGKSLTQLNHPQGMIVDHSNNIVVADGRNDRIMRWSPGSKEGSIIVGGNGEGQQSNQFNGPMGLSFDREGNLYVVDWDNHRVQKFDIDSNGNSCCDEMNIDGQFSFL